MNKKQIIEKWRKSKSWIPFVINKETIVTHVPEYVPYNKINEWVHKWAHLNSIPHSFGWDYVNNCYNCTNDDSHSSHDLNNCECE